MLLQYNVTVEGVGTTGTKTKGQNMLQFTTPNLVHLKSTKPMSATSGTATASTQPGSAFPQV